MLNKLFTWVKGKALIGAFFVFIFNIDSLPSSPKEKAYIRPRAIIEAISPDVEKSIPLSKILVLPKGQKDANILLKSNESHLILDEEQITNLLPESYRDFQILGGKCEVLFLNQSFSGEELEESLQTELQKHNTDNSEFRITYLGGTVQLPSGFEKKWGNFPREMSPGTKIFTLNSWKQNKRIYSTRLKFKIEKKIIIGIVAKRVDRFHLIQKEDVEMKSIFTEESARDLVTEDPTGLAALTILEPGMILRKKHIRLVRAVEKGSEIETIYTSGNITVKGKAIAKSSGNPGDRIEAKSLPGNVILRGVVKSRGTMEVE